MIDVKVAVAAAEAYVPQLYESVQGILLEEVELERERSLWSVTLSFFTRKEGIRMTTPLERLMAMNSTLASLSSPDPDVLRLFRRFLVDARTGEVVAMKMREKDA
jgi:hypothetical protein